MYVCMYVHPNLVWKIVVLFVNEGGRGSRGEFEGARVEQRMEQRGQLVSFPNTTL
jgi:hypothetical protein